MNARVVALAIACASVAAACTDPGCIRNSECQTEFRCIDAVCVRAVPDGGATGGNAAPAKDAATSAEMDASLSPPKDASLTKDASPPKNASNPTGEDAGR